MPGCRGAGVPGCRVSALATRLYRARTRLRELIDIQSKQDIQFKQDTQSKQKGSAS